ncbi:hypothetical protein ACQPZJ_23395 [Actinoplanes sp. CA-054009]
MTPDSDIRDALAAYTRDAPPPAFTVTDVVTAGRRRRRRTVIAGAAAALVLIAGGIAVLARPGGAPYVPAGPSWELLEPAPFCAAATPVPTASPSSYNGMPLPSRGVEARLSCYLATAVPPLLPSVTYYRDVSTPATTLPLEVYAGRVFDPKRPEETSPPYFTSSAVIRDAEGAGDIGFGLTPRYRPDDEARTECAGRECTIRTGPHGELVTVIDVTMESTGVRLVNVYVHKADTIVMASASNGLLKEATVDPGRAYSGADYIRTRDDLPLSVEQLIGVAAAPEMELFP